MGVSAGRLRVGRDANVVVTTVGVVVLAAAVIVLAAAVVSFAATVVVLAARVILNGSRDFNGSATLWYLPFESTCRYCNIPASSK
jgi:hypothetical protein